MTVRRVLLLVEDDPDDVMLMRAAWGKTTPPVELQVAADGLEALDYLRAKGRFAGAAPPALVLLDWRLPGKSGLEVLREVRADPLLKRLPVLVLTTSSSEKDITDAYEAGANCFLTKPSGLDSLDALAACLADFWLRWARLPPVTSPSQK